MVVCVERKDAIIVMCYVYITVYAITVMPKDTESLYVFKIYC